MCRRGEVGSHILLNRDITDAECEVFAELGFERAVLGSRYRKNYRCPVNGDGYWETRQEILDSEGTWIGSREVPEGPWGEL